MTRHHPLPHALPYVPPSVGEKGESAPEGSIRRYEDERFETNERAREREHELAISRRAALMVSVFGMIVEPRFHPLAASCHLEHPTDPILSGVELNFAGKAQILGFCAGVETLNYYIKKGDNYKPGDLLGSAYYVADEEDELWVNYQEKELNNGRLAMVAFAGFVTQYLLYGNIDDMLFKPMVKASEDLTCYGLICAANF